MEYLWFAIEVFVNLYQIWICLYMLGKIFTKRTGTRFENWAMPLCLAIGSGGLTLFHLIGIRGSFDFIPGLTAFFIYLFIFRKGLWVFKCMWIFICWVMMSGVTMLGMSFFTSSPGIEVEALYNPTPVRFAAMVCINIMLIPFVMLIPKLQKEQRTQSQYAPLTLVVMLCIPVASAIYLLLIQHYYNILPIDKRSSPSIYAASILALFIGIAALWLFDRVASQARHLAQSEADVSQLHMEKMHQKDMQAIYDQMRIWKHDYNNQIGVMRALVEKKQYDELELYIIQNSESFQRIASYINTGNVALDALLDMKSALAKQDQITFITDIALPAIVPMGDGDFCALIGNLLDNAIEANERISDASQRSVSLKIEVLQRNLHISIQNPTDGRIQLHGTSIVTSKIDKTMHGFGLRSIERIVEAHNGYMNIKHEDRAFSVEILIPAGSPHVG